MIPGIVGVFRTRDWRRETLGDGLARRTHGGLGTCHKIDRAVGMCWEEAPSPARPKMEDPSTIWIPWGCSATEALDD